MTITDPATVKQLEFKRFSHLHYLNLSVYVWVLPFWQTAVHTKPMDVPKLKTKATYGDDDSDDVTHQTSIVAHVELLNAFAALAALFRSHQDLPYTSKQSTLCKQTQVAARRHATHHEVLNHATTPTVYVISQLCNWKKTNSCRSI